jgi:formate hydrogenlyase subunit 3/multisubunit Na+/H+ antiporter MnhD subunit
MDFIRFFLILIVPGLIGALAFSIVDRLRTEIKAGVALIIDLLTFIVMITGLYFIKGITTFTMLLIEFDCLSFTRNYALLSILISILIGVGLGFLRNVFFWIRH